MVEKKKKRQKLPEGSWSWGGEYGGLTFFNYPSKEWNKANIYIDSSVQFSAGVAMELQGRKGVEVVCKYEFKTMEKLYTE